MEEDDVKELISWLVSHGYYVGNSEVSKSLRDLADYYDD